MRITKYDICGKTIEYKETGAVAYVSVNSHLTEEEYKHEDYELCPECTEGLNAYLADKRKTMNN